MFILSRIQKRDVDSNNAWQVLPYLTAYTHPVFLPKCIFTIIFTANQGQRWQNQHRFLQRSASYCKHNKPLDGAVWWKLTVQMRLKLQCNYSQPNTTTAVGFKSRHSATLEIYPLRLWSPQRFALTACLPSSPSWKTVVHGSWEAFLTKASSVVRQRGNKHVASSCKFNRWGIDPSKLIKMLSSPSVRS